MLFKWSATRHRLQNGLILLSNLRLNTLLCDGGQVRFSASAPVLYSRRGRPDIAFHDKGVLVVIDGPRTGTNITMTDLRKSDVTTHARYTGQFDLLKDNVPPWVADRVLSLGCTPAWPVERIVVPDIYRLSRDKESFRPIVTADILQELGLDKDASPEKLQESFMQIIKTVGMDTDDGWIVPFGMASGGCCVVRPRGITIRSGSVPHQMLAGLFLQESNNRNWEVFK